jgi:hypothetical protein
MQPDYSTLEYFPYQSSSISCIFNIYKFRDPQKILDSVDGVEDGII